jgi:hypothetical protein
MDLLKVLHLQHMGEAPTKGLHVRQQPFEQSGQLDCSGVARLRSPAETAAALAVSPRSTSLGKLRAQNFQATSSSRRAVFP